MAILDIAMRHTATSMYKCVGDAFYDERKREAVHLIEPAGKFNQFWFGYRQTVINTASGPMLLIDRAVTCVVAPLSLLEFIKDKTGGRTLTLENLTSGKVGKRLTEGKPQKVTTSHSRREYTVRGLDTVAARDATFHDSETGEEVTLAPSRHPKPAR